MKKHSRREFMRTAGGIAAAASLLSGSNPALAFSQARQEPPNRITAASAFFPRPYQLAGKRLVFTNWSYIQPGRFIWSGAAGALDLHDTASPEDLKIERFDDPYGIRLLAQPANRVGPVLKPEHPWEAMGTCIQTVVREGGLYRAWTVSNAELQHDFAGYMESADGMTWKRPNLGIYEFNGSRQNNLLFYNGWVHTVFIDPTASKEERYKIVIWSFQQLLKNLKTGVSEEALRLQPRSIGGGVSPDGLRWKFLTEPICEDHNDTQNTAYYDESLGKYVLYNRKIMHGRRAIGRSESADFRRFPFPEPCVEPGPDLLPSDDLYTNCRTTIPGAADHHLMFPTVYHLGGDIGTIKVLSSFDGKVWHWLPGGPILTPSAPGQWDSGWLTAHPNLIELPSGDFALSYTGQETPHKYPRGQLRYAGGYAVWPKGRIVALEAEERGQFSTLPLIPPGRKLLINAVTARAGRIVVEVAAVGEKGARASSPYQGVVAMPGRSFAENKPIVGDHFRTPVTWGGRDDLGHAEGGAVILRFRLEKAKLFGLEFA